MCISSIGSTADCTMVEIETILAPLSFGGDGPTRFLGMVQLLGDSGAFAGKPIAFQRLVGSKLIQEDEPAATLPPPPPPPGDFALSHPKAPHLRLVVSRDRAATIHYEMDEKMQQLISALEINRAARLSLLGS